MTHEQFFVGLIFYTATGAWQVTDKGGRTVIAVHIEELQENETLGSPPYCYDEEVFDEYDFGGCSLVRYDIE